MSKVIKLSDSIIKELNDRKHPGQSYDGVIRELIEQVEKGEKICFSYNNRNNTSSIFLV